MIAVPEYTVKGALAVKTGLQKQVCDGQVGIFQQGAGIVQTHRVQVLIKIAVEGSGKDSGKGIGAAAEVVSHAGQCHRFLKVGGDIGDGSVDNVIASYRTFLHKLETWETAR